ncbi:MAG: glutathione S-transferase family protein, partial [Pseudomonadota bacterium]
MTLKLIGARDTRTRRIIWVLEELGLSYEFDPLPPRDPEVRRLNPSGKVPVVIVDQLVLTESVAIMHYLADREGALTFPPGTTCRAQQDGYTFRILDEIEGPLWTAARHSFILPKEMRHPDIKTSLRWEFGEALNLLAADLGDGPYLMGDTMTVPDILL